MKGKFIMKKTLSIILTLCMVLGLCSFSVAAAPEGTAITDAAGFLAMDPAGTYYLANDITIAESYAQAFTGTFDGNGKTVTVSAPMFVNFAGTAKNFTIEGAVTVAEGHAGALANDSFGGTAVVLENITNNADVTSNDAAGGLLGFMGVSGEANGIPLTVTNCVNNGTITAVKQAGGIISAAYFNAGTDFVSEAGATLTGCVNNGTVNSSSSRTGGIIGQAIYSKNVVITKCINNADVCGGLNTGGIVGHTTASALYMSFCQNNGNISNTEVPADSAVYAGGLLGYGQGTKVKTLTAGEGYYANKIEFCINTGDIVGAYRAGGIASSTGASGAFGLSSINYCINTGNITARGLGTSTASNAAGGILGYGYGSGDKEYAVVTNCITTGNIESQGETKGSAAYFIGYINSANATVANNTALGTLTSASGSTFAIGWNNANPFTEASVGNNIPAGCPYNLAYESEAVSTRAFDIGTTDEAALTSGATIYALNQAYKAAAGTADDVVFMTIDGTFTPTLIAAEDGSNSVILNADGSYSNPQPEPEVTEPEVTEPEVTEPVVTEPVVTEPTPDTTEPGSSSETGDSFVIFAVIAAISVLGVAVVAKKREN